VLCRIQFKLMHHSEFLVLTDFCVQHFGAVRDLHDSKTQSTPNSSASFGSNISNVSQFSNRSQLDFYSSQSTRKPNSIPRKIGPTRPVTKMLADSQDTLNSTSQIGDVQVPNLKAETWASCADETRHGSDSDGTEAVHLTESMVLQLIQDDSFMSEVLYTQLEFIAA
jgi:hypothetical protein